MITAFSTAKNGSVAAQATAEQATGAKDVKLTDLVEGMKSDIRYAENTVNFDDEKLKLIGWGGRRAPVPLLPPGQTRLLEGRNLGDAAITLTWKAPVDGGKPSAYRIMRRERPEGLWGDVGTAVVTEVTLFEQPRGKEFEFRVVAVNRAGEGEPSNTIVATF